MHATEDSYMNMKKRQKTPFFLFSFSLFWKSLSGLARRYLLHPDFFPLSSPLFLLNSSFFLFFFSRFLETLTRLTVSTQIFTPDKKEKEGRKESHSSRKKTTKKNCRPASRLPSHNNANTFLASLAVCKTALPLFPFFLFFACRRWRKTRNRNKKEEEKHLEISSPLRCIASGRPLTTSSSWDELPSREKQRRDFGRIDGKEERKREREKLA